MAFNRKSVVIALGLNMALICTAHADLVTNGNFLTAPDYAGASGWFLSTDASGTGFTYDASHLFQFGFGAPSSNNIPVEIYQVFTGLTVGDQYTINFNIAMDPTPSGNTLFSADFGGTNLLTLTAPGSPSFIPVSYSFTETAIASKEILSFTGYNTNVGAFNYLSSVSGSAVPEAEEWAMMLLALPLMGWVASRRRLTA
jgi:hypothetical protein